MSEYQYYEWQAIDRLLTDKELAQVARLSSHMDTVTASQAVVTYHWGNFKHDPIEVLLKYFDAMLYWANWGSRRLAFRFPKDAIDAERVRAYWVDGWTTLREEGGWLVLDIDVHEEPGYWEEEPIDLDSLIWLRQQIIEGDDRALYLAWLKAAEALEVVEDEGEPPVPVGLQTLDGSLREFADAFLDLDPLLLQIAASASGPLQPVSDKRLADALAQLPAQECHAYLQRMLAGELQVRSSLRKRLMEMVGVQSGARPGSRTADELLEGAQLLHEEERRRQEQAAAHKRRQQLDDLARREEEVWRQVESLIELKQTRPYEQAVALLEQLRDLAEDRKSVPQFEERVRAIKLQYSRRPALMRLIDRAGL